MITGTLTIPIAHDEAFRKSCRTFDVKLRCISEGVNSNRYEIKCELVCELYGLGQAMGIELFYQSQQEEKLKTKYS
jgi:hypothetical protein